MGRRDQQIHHGDILQNKAHESSPTCPALLPEKHPVLIHGEPKMENLLTPLGPCFTLKNLCPSRHWNTPRLTSQLLFLTNIFLPDLKNCSAFVVFSPQKK